MTKTFRRLQQLRCALVAALALGACSDSGPGGTPFDGSTADTAQSEGGPPPGKELVFSLKSVLDSAPFIDQIAIGGSGSQAGVAYLRHVPDADWPLLDCAANVGGGGPQKKPTQDLYYVHFDGSDWGTPAKVDQTYGPRVGVSLAMDSSAGAHIGYLGGGFGGFGTPSVQECYSADAVIASSSNAGQSWSRRAVASASVGAGDTVGYWSAIALDCSGQPQLTFQDLQFGIYEEDGTADADWRFGGGEVIAMDTGDGQYGDLLYSEDCEPVAVGYNGVAVGSIGGIRLATRSGGSWQVRQLVAGQTQFRPSFATDGDGVYGLAYYEPSDRSLYYVESSDLESWSQPRVVDPSATNHGTHASLAFDSAGNPAVSYYRCARAGEDLCDPVDDALMFAYRIDGVWKRWVVDEGGPRRCGTFTALTFDADDEPLIAYECVTLDNVSGDFPVRSK